MPNQKASGLLDLRPYLLSLLPISCTEHPVLGLVLLEEAKINKVTDFKKLIDCLSRMLASFFAS